METLLTLVHVLIAVVLIGLVLIQDSKGGALGIGGGGGGSNSLLGAGGAQTLAAKATRWVAVIFAITCLSLSIWTTKKTQSVIDGASTLSVPTPSVPGTTETPAATTTAPAATEMAAPPAVPATEKK